MPVSTETIQDIFKAVQAEEAAAASGNAPPPETPAAEPPKVEAAPPPVAEPPKVEAAPPEPAEPEIHNVIRSQAVPLSKYREVLRAGQEARAALDEQKQRVAVLEAQVAQAMAAQRPAAAAAAAADSDTDEEWFEKMEAAGAAVPPELAKGIQSMLKKVDALEKLVGTQGQLVSKIQDARDRSVFESEFGRLQKRCPQVEEETLLEMVSDGVDPRHIVQLYDRFVVGAQSAAPAPVVTPAAGPKPSAPPAVHGAAPAAPREDAVPENYGLDDFMKWAAPQLH